MSNAASNLRANSEKFLPPTLLFQFPTPVEFFQELGLGTGIDATDPKLWEFQTKTVLKQVREIEPNQKNIKRSHVNKTVYCSEIIETLFKHQVQLSGQLRDPSITQLKISVHAEQLRERDTEMKAVFVKYHTRSISFQDTEESRLRQVLSTTPIKSEKQFKDDYFPKLLCLAIQESCQLDVDPNSDTSSLLAGMESYMKESEQNFDSVVAACDDFVASVHATHYVSSIELGAIRSAAFPMELEDQELNDLGIEFEKGENRIVSQSKFEQVMKSSTAKITEIGNPDGSVDASRSKEEVIAFTIQPIYFLVSGRLQEALKKAVTNYVESQLTIPDNPQPTYNITCNIKSKQVFWTVTDKNEIIGTTKSKEAHPFNVESTGSSVHKYEFHISYYKQGNGLMYLSCNGDMFGNHYGPLGVEQIQDHKHTHFVLHSPLQHDVVLCMNLQLPCTTLPCSYKPKHLKTWTHDGEPLMINCSRRQFKMDGYLAMEEYKEASTSTDCSYKLVARGKVDTTSSTCAFQFSLVSKKKGISPSNQQQDVV